ncbi:hypothetical protein F3Y22_tig00110370pilonHSYRG00033 [Hibiscus syriacus]|uniref:pyridoxal 5'-phosphate synthase n=1 Tax=Hibiscus syriacus TaxID=106335 RepID=A0A6A3AYM2_HIBSY|nr:hypothetical protein F3Y22_tig00110370pilonHSYRG00033 [Hibiscus syriacus]
MTQNKPWKLPWLFHRSHSTGHPLVQLTENRERFTQRLPEDAQNPFMNNSSCGVFPEERSSRRGYRKKYKLRLPQYPGTSMCVRIGKPPQIDISALRENYISPEFLEEQVEDDPLDQFRKWFDDAEAAGLKEPTAMALSTTGKDRKPYASGFSANHMIWILIRINVVSIMS